MSETQSNASQERANAPVQASRARRAATIVAVTAAGVGTGGVLGFLTGDHSAAELRKEALVTEACADELESGAWRNQDSCGLTYDRFEAEGILSPNQMRNVAALAREEADQSTSFSAEEKAVMLGAIAGMACFAGAVAFDGARYHPNV
jgi:hypothetical protein